MQRQDAHPGLQQPLDQHAVGTLDRDDLDLEAAPAPRTARSRRPRHARTSPPRSSSPAGSSISTSCFSDTPNRFPHSSPSLASFRSDTRLCPDPEVPLRVLIDKALTRGYVLSPLAAPHHRRDGLVFDWPSAKGKRSRPSPGGGRGDPSMPYERSSAGAYPSPAAPPPNCAKRTIRSWWTTVPVVGAGFAIGEFWEVRGDARAQIRFHLRTGITSVVPWLVSGSSSLGGGLTLGELCLPLARRRRLVNPWRVAPIRATCSACRGPPAAA